MTVSAAPFGHVIVGSGVNALVAAAMQSKMGRKDCVRKREDRCGLLEAMNVTLTGGDSYSGAATLDRYFLWRPFADSVTHETPVRELCHIGASTHPDPGQSGGSGTLLVARL